MSKRKKFNPLEYRRKLTQIAAKDLLLHCVAGYYQNAEGVDEVEVTNIKTLKPVAITRQLALDIAELPMKWLVGLYVFGKESNGKNKLVCEHMRISPRTENQLNEFLTKNLLEMTESAKFNVATNGWAAMPVPPAYQDEMTDELLYMRITSIIERPEFYELEKNHA